MSINGHPTDSTEIRLGEPPPFVRLPDSHTFFARRADRFRRLASGHSLEQFLTFMSVLANAQQIALDEMPPAGFPDRDHSEGCGSRPIPLPDAWAAALMHSGLEALMLMIAAMKSAPLPVQTTEAIARLEHANLDSFNMWANAIAHGTDAPVDRALAPFVFGALQVVWTGMASRLNAQMIARPTAPGLCPACGSAPVSSVVSIEPAIRGNRYVCCGLCATQWHTVRIKCTQCESTKGIAYYGIEGGSEGVKAETCETCKTYLKVMYMEKDPEMDPVADDLATIALDLLLVEAGWRAAHAATVPFRKRHMIQLRAARFGLTRIVLLQCRTAPGSQKFGRVGYSGDARKRSSTRASGSWSPVASTS